MVHSSTGLGMAGGYQVAKKWFGRCNITIAIESIAHEKQVSNRVTIQKQCFPVSRRVVGTTANCPRSVNLQLRSN